jgi:hypothetical protein
VSADAAPGYLEQSYGALFPIVEEAQVNHDGPAPKIVDISWGRMEVEGLGVGKDYKLYPGGGREWDWSETGTRHVPGIQPADVEELLAHGATTVILSRGMDQRLQVDPATLTYLDERSIEVHVVETREAVKIYNELADRVAVAGLFHSTC